MTVAVHQVGNVGSVFIFTVLDQADVAVDLSVATVLEARFKPTPGGVTFVRTGVLTGDGTDGKFEYVTIAGDLSTAGDCWQRQGRVVVTGLGEFYTFTREFAVKANL